MGWVSIAGVKILVRLVVAKVGHLSLFETTFFFDLSASMFLLLASDPYVRSENLSFTFLSEV